MDGSKLGQVANTGQSATISGKLVANYGIVGGKRWLGLGANAGRQALRRAGAGAGSVLVLHGPNPNLLGTREPQIYGRDTLANINRRLAAQARAAGAKLAAFQSNCEGALIDRVHAARGEDVAYILINPGGLTHTSVALHDAFSRGAIPLVEVHLSNIHAREPFRQHSYFSDKAIGIVAGLGPQRYELALACVLKRLGEAG